MKLLKSYIKRDILGLPSLLAMLIIPCFIINSWVHWSFGILIGILLVAFALFVYAKAGYIEDK